MHVTVKKPPKQIRTSPPVPSGDADKLSGVSNALWDQIARKAFELWEERGRQDGHALRDWLDAEAQVMEPCHATRQ